MDSWDGCLACGLETARTSHGAAHDLADSLCLACIVTALQAGPQRPQQGSGITPVNLHNRTCSGQRHRCPRPPAVHYLNRSWCATCAPAVPLAVAGPAPERATTPLATDDGMPEAVLAVLNTINATVLRLRDGYPYGEPLEGQ